MQEKLGYLTIASRYKKGNDRRIILVKKSGSIYIKVKVIYCNNKQTNWIPHRLQNE